MSVSKTDKPPSFSAISISFDDSHKKWRSQGENKIASTVHRLYQPLYLGYIHCTTRLKRLRGLVSPHPKPPLPNVFHYIAEW